MGMTLKQKENAQMNHVNKVVLFYVLFFGYFIYATTWYTMVILEVAK